LVKLKKIWPRRFVRGVLQLGWAVVCVLVGFRCGIWWLVSLYFLFDIRFFLFFCFILLVGVFGLFLVLLLRSFPPCVVLGCASWRLRER